MSTTAPGRDVPARRPWVAALLAFVLPGLGHLYLRRWVRALLWFVTVWLLGLLLVPSGAMSQELSLEAVRQNVGAIPQEAMLAILAATGLSMLDAFLIARRQRRPSQAVGDARACPNCGKQLDEDLAFCHWCTTELEPAGEPEETDEPLISR